LSSCASANVVINVDATSQDIKQNCLFDISIRYWDVGKAIFSLLVQALETPALPEGGKNLYIIHFCLLNDGLLPESFQE